MTTLNLQIPYLGQNVAQPEVLENEVKDIIDAAICGIFSKTMPVDATYVLRDLSIAGTAEYPREWQFGILRLSGTNTIVQELHLPDGYIMRYAVENNTGQDLLFKTVSGTGITIPNLAIYQVFSDGININRIT